MARFNDVLDASPHEVVENTDSTEEAAASDAEVPTTLSSAIPHEEHIAVARRDRAVQEVVRAAMEGTLRGHRELQYWEPEKFSLAHVQMCSLKAAGYSVEEIADLLDYSKGLVGQIMAHPYAKRILGAIAISHARQAGDLRQRLERTAPTMLDIIEDITTDPDSPKELRSKNAFRYLDIAGYGRNSKMTVEGQITMNSKEANLLKAALGEVAETYEEADWSFVSTGEEQIRKHDPTQTDVGGGDAVSNAEVDDLASETEAALGGPASSSTSLPVEAPTNDSTSPNPRTLEPGDEDEVEVTHSRQTGRRRDFVRGYNNESREEVA